MDETLRTAAISPLRQRLIGDMNMRRFSQETQRNYIRDVWRFATFLGRSPHTATADDPNACITARHHPAWSRAAADAQAMLTEKLVSSAATNRTRTGSPAHRGRPRRHPRQVTR
jgi:hypothetical protein